MAVMYSAYFFCRSFIFFCLVFVKCLCARLFICASWSPAGKGLTTWLSLVVSNCEFVTFPLVSWVRCGTWLYWFLIFVPLLTFNQSLEFSQPFKASWTAQSLIDSCQAHLPEHQNSFASCYWQRTTLELHVQNKLLVCSIGFPCSHWLFRFSVLHSNKTVNTIKY